MKCTRATLLGAVAAVAVAVGGISLMLTGCEGLDYSAGAEGTGVQIVGAIIVLAKYHASDHQKAVAEERARAVVTRVVQPVYEKKRATVSAGSARKIEAARRDYDKRISAVAAKPSAAPAKTAPAAGENDEAKRLAKEKESALAKLQSDAAAELASMDRDWRSIGAVPVHAAGPMPTSPHVEETVPTPSTHDPEALMASARAHLPNYIAVSVPPQGNTAEQGGKATVMLWDTRRQRLASDDVLVLGSKPVNGVDAKIDGVSARFAVTDGGSR